MDVSTEVRARLVHLPGCREPGFTFWTLEPAGRPGVLIIELAYCRECGAEVRDVTLGGQPS